MFRLKNIPLEEIMKMKKGDAEKLNQLGQEPSDKKVRRLEKLVRVLAIV